ncbi:MAG: hypothetical protein JWM56_315 [Candidatus Peribacteria bacterium]|nr:hypothetical protein [Candidatus Peribacteria bacterium]
MKKEWFAPFVCYAKTHQWIDGYNVLRHGGAEVRMALSVKAQKAAHLV